MSDDSASGASDDDNLGVLDRISKQGPGVCERLSAQVNIRRNKPNNRVVTFNDRQENSHDVNGRRREIRSQRERHGIRVSSRVSSRSLSSSLERNRRGRRNTNRSDSDEESNKNDI